MSGGPCCACPENKQTKWRTKFWRTVHLLCNYSAFNGYRHTYSDYSQVRCLWCGRFWRTKANYVFQLRRATHDEVLANPLKDKS